VNRRTIAAIGAAGMLVAFVAAVFLYERREAVQADARSALHHAPPFVRDGAPTLGPEDAQVVLVEFFDPGCETCRVFADPVKEIVASHEGKVRLVLRYVAFHQGADQVAAALEASRRQGKFWETLDRVYATQREWADHHHPNPDALWPHLPSVGLDVEELREDMRRPDVVTALQQDRADALALGVRGTPTFFVNGRPLPRFGLSELEALVRETVRDVYGD
jgi:protein-disulfide isomerase